MKYEVVEEHLVDKSTGVVGDSTIRLTGLKTSRWYSDTLSLVVKEDYATRNFYWFLTNDFTHFYLTISELYRERWQVECGLANLIKPKRPINDSDSDQLKLWGNFFAY